MSRMRTTHEGDDQEFDTCSACRGRHPTPPCRLCWCRYRRRLHGPPLAHPEPADAVHHGSIRVDGAAALCAARVLDERVRLCARETAQAAVWRVLWRRDSAGVDLVAVGSDEIDAQDSLVLERLQKLGVRHAATLRRPHNLQRVLRDVILTSRPRHPVEILPSVVVAAKANACGSQRALVQICSRGQRDAQRDGARSGDCSADSVGSADPDLHTSR